MKILLKVNYFPQCLLNYILEKEKRECAIYCDIVFPYF